MATDTLEKETSTLSKIVNEVEKLDEVQKRKLLMQLRKEDMLLKAKAIDEAMEQSSISESELDDTLSNFRKQRYEQGLQQA